MQEERPAICCVVAVHLSVLPGRSASKCLLRKCRWPGWVDSGEKLDARNEESVEVDWIFFDLQALKPLVLGFSGATAIVMHTLHRHQQAFKAHFDAAE